MYKEADPDQDKLKKDEINKFNTPEVSNISKNFAIIVLYPKTSKNLFKNLFLSGTKCESNAASSR